MIAHRLLTTALCLLLLLAVAGCTVKTSTATRTVYVEPPPPPPPPPPEVEFYELSQYGEWIDAHPFGMVWRPYVTSDWGPYIYGHWVWSEWGWTWVSYEPFGWAVYHYGYWRYSTVWGWIWVPGSEWEPVRVQWVWYGDYVCWAPLPPPGYYLPDPWLVHTTNVWVVVHARHFTHYDLHRFHVKPPRYKDRYASRVTVYREPPRRSVIEKLTRKTITRVDVKVKNYESGGRTYKKVVLPASEKKIVDQYRPQVKKRAAGERTKVSPEPKDKKKRTTRSYKSTKRTDETQSQSKTSSQSRSKTKSKTKSDKKDSGKKSSKQKK
jgi:hypothetical protein